MKKSAILLCCVLLSAMAWGQRRSGAPAVRSAKRAVSDHAVVGHRAARGALKGNAAATVDDLRLAQAPGIVQINTLDSDLSAAFIATDVIPAGSKIIVQVWPPDGGGSPLEVIKSVSEDLKARSVLSLPRIRDFGNTWPSGAVTYNVIVESGGNRTHSAAEFPVGAWWEDDYLSGAVPLIYQPYNDKVNRQIILTLDGQFSTQPASVVLNSYDLGYPLIVPASAMQQSESQIVVNLSKVPGLALERYGDYVVTMGQGGWTDSRTFTFVPFSKGTYDPAPPLEESPVQ